MPKENTVTFERDSETTILARMIEFNIAITLRNWAQYLYLVHNSVAKPKSSLKEEERRRWAASGALPRLLGCGNNNLVSIDSFPSKLSVW